MFRFRLCCPAQLSQVSSLLPKNFSDILKLDVGCGAVPSGDVNVDLCRGVTSHRLSDEVVPVCSNFVLCDALFLPFRCGVFSEVVCRQLIEHIGDPFRLVVELRRVCCGLLVIETVHRYGELFCLPKKWRVEHHVSNFNFRWFLECARVLRLRVRRCYVLEYYYFWLGVARLPFIIGVELEVFK